MLIAVIFILLTASGFAQNKEEYSVSFCIKTATEDTCFTLNFHKKAWFILYYNGGSEVMTVTDGLKVKIEVAVIGGVVVRFGPKEFHAHKYGTIWSYTADSDKAVRISWWPKVEVSEKPVPEPQLIPQPEPTPQPQPTPKVPVEELMFNIGPTLVASDQGLAPGISSGKGLFFCPNTAHDFGLQFMGGFIARSRHSVLGIGILGRNWAVGLARFEYAQGFLEVVPFTAGVNFKMGNFAVEIGASYGFVSGPGPFGDDMLHIDRARYYQFKTGEEYSGYSSKPYEMYGDESHIYEGSIMIGWRGVSLGWQYANKELELEFDNCTPRQQWGSEPVWCRYSGPRIQVDFSLWGIKLQGHYLFEDCLKQRKLLGHGLPIQQAELGIRYKNWHFGTEKFFNDNFPIFMASYVVTLDM